MAEAIGVARLWGEIEIHERNGVELVLDGGTWSSPFPCAAKFIQPSSSSGVEEMRAPEVRG